MGEKWVSRSTSLWEEIRPRCVLRRPANRSGRPQLSAFGSRARGQWLANAGRQTAPEGHGQHVWSFTRPCPRWSSEPRGQTPAKHLGEGQSPSRPYGRRQHRFLASWISCRRGRAPHRRRSQGVSSQSWDAPPLVGHLKDCHEIINGK